MTRPINEIAKSVALTELPGVSDQRAIELLDWFGSPEEVYSASRDQFSEFHYFDDPTYDKLHSLDEEIDEIASQMEHCRQNNIQLIPVFDSRYPERLKAVSGPLLLYARGNLSLLEEDTCVGFTGTREAGDDAVRWSRKIAAALAEEGRVIVSGGANGVDTAAHRGALDQDGETIVVLGTGINVPYPKSNEGLFEEIVTRNGLLLSQSPPNKGPSRSGFLNRNATLTGLSHAVTVVATDGSGGTMSTYSDAKSQNKLIFCPDPDLELKPVDGIEQIATEEAIPIRNAGELLAYQTSEIENSDTDSQTSQETGSRQASMDDFT